MGAVTRGLWPSLLLAAALTASPLVVHAGPVDGRAGDEAEAASKREAQQRFRRGMELYDENDFRGALVEFERAYELAPTFRVLYNIGQVRYQLRDYAGALRAFEQYLNDGGQQIERRRRAEVERELVKLRGRVARISISTTVPGADVFVDDVLVGTAPLADPIVVSAGRRKVTASKKGFAPVTRVVDVASADSIELKLELTALAPKPSADHAPASPERPRAVLDDGAAGKDSGPAPSREVPWVAWGVTGALALGATVTGVMALGASSDLADKRATPDVGRDSLDRAESKTSNLALVTDVLGGAAIVVGGYATWRTFFAPPAESDAAPPAEVKVGVTPGGVVVRGAF